MADTVSRKRGRPRSFQDEPEGKIVRSLDKAMGLLKIVARGSGLSLSEITDASAMPAATAYRALLTLQKHGIVSFDDHSQLWRIDVEAFRIGSAFLANTSIVEQARPVMQELMQQTGETTNLGILSGQEVVFLGQVETHEPIRAFFRPGTNGSIHASGIGKALFAFQPAAAARRLADNLELTGFTKNTIQQADHMMQMRQAALQLGYAVDDEERTMGMRCIAAPIFNNFAEAVAAISISGPTVRVETDAIPEIGQKVRAAADEISKYVGGRIRSFDAD